MFKLGCCGSKICAADNFNHNKNIMLKFAAAAATLVTDQVVLVFNQPRAKHLYPRVEEEMIEQSIYYTLGDQPIK